MSKKVIAVLRLKDRHTLDWLVKAFGFAKTEDTPDDTGGLLSGQLQYGDDFIMLSTIGSDEHPTGVAGMFLMVDTDQEVDDAYAQALVAGAVSVREPTNVPQGGRTMTVRDPEGNRWSVGSFKPARKPAELEAGAEPAREPAELEAGAEPAEASPELAAGEPVAPPAE